MMQGSRIVVKITFSDIHWKNIHNSRGYGTLHNVYY